MKSKQKPKRKKPASAREALWPDDSHTDAHNDRVIKQLSEDLCTCPPAVKYGIDTPGLGCEVCPYCAEKLDKQDIPF